MPPHALTHALTEKLLPVQLFGIVFPDTVRQRHRQLQVRLYNSVSAISP